MQVFEKIIVLVVLHLIGDYLLQNDFIAKTKGENIYHLIVHCILYCLPFLIMFGFVWQIAIIFVTHFLIDLLKARYKLMSYTWDQIMHYSIIIILFL